MGIIKKWHMQIPHLSGLYERRVYLYLPDSYGLDIDKRYPVMYMFDGQNIFFDSDATYGKSWGMLSYMNNTKKEMIIVAIECNNEGYRRLEEYSPVDFYYPPAGMIKGRAEAYMQWLTDSLKPFIDEGYRTLPDRQHTIICGSSMGGLMALYGAVAYNHIFQRAACLSPSLWVNPGAVCEIIRNANMLEDTCIYMDYGSAEMKNHESIPESLLKASAELLTQNTKITLRIVPGGIHAEASWEQQIPHFMSILGL